MSQKYNSVFDDIYRYVRGSPLAAWIFILSIACFLIGINGFYEDTNSSVVGIQMIETGFNVKAAAFPVTYWGIAVFFQISSVILFFAYLSNRKDNWWAVWAASVFQLIDFMFDLVYRANGDFGSIQNILFALILAFVFTTLCSEVALTFGFGLTSKLLVEGLMQLSFTFKNLVTGITQFAQIIVSGEVGEQGHLDSSLSREVQDRKFGDAKPSVRSSSQVGFVPPNNQREQHDKERDQALKVIAEQRGGKPSDNLPPFHASERPSWKPNGKDAKRRR